MSTQKEKFALFQRLQSIGFTYEESVSLRRIEMTLQRWGEAECGDSNDHFSTCIERDETTGRPFRVVHYHNELKSRRYPVADREAGALKRLAQIVINRNVRVCNSLPDGQSPDHVFWYHQTDCRGCNVYLVTRSQRTHPVTGELMDLGTCYTNGLAVCC